MKQLHSRAERDLYQRVGEILHYLWDPIGVSSFPEARDEYDCYVPHVFSMLQQRLGRIEISDYLISIEQSQMGLTISEKVRESRLAIAEILIEHKECIDQKSA
jgi:hypothetical protein